MAHELLGTYELTTVYTSQGGRPYLMTGTLTLSSPEHRPRQERPRVAAWPVAGRYMPSESGSSAQGVVVEGEILYRCYICLDISPVLYRLTWVTDSAFGGTWEDRQTGISRVYDSTGRELPNPAGHYCARRVSIGSLGD
jgi:hypothetical protein